jgi:integrase
LLPFFVKKEDEEMAKHRGWNEGTISKRSNGSFRAQITLEGRRLSFTGKTVQECRGWIKQTIGQIDGGLSYQGASMTFGEYLEIWLRTLKQNRRAKTFLSYRRIADRYILPAFGAVRLRDLQSFRIEQYLTTESEKGVGDRTCQIIYAIMHACLETTVRKGLLGRNPLDAVEKPKVKHPIKIVTLQPEQIQQLLIAAEGDRDAVLYHLALTTGLREGEIIGLKWSDLDWERSRLKIQRQVQRIDGQGLVFSEPKTQFGNRMIALGQITLEKLQEHRQRQELEKAVAGQQWQENGLIFPTTIGTPRDPHNLLKSFKKLLAKARLPNMRFHDLRHTSVTLILNDIGAPIKEAQHRAGHASPSTTINIYGGETTSKLDQVVAQSLDELITPVSFKLHPNCTKEESLSER